MADYLLNHLCGSNVIAWLQPVFNQNLFKILYEKNTNSVADIIKKIGLLECPLNSLKAKVVLVL